MANSNNIIVTANLNSAAADQARIVLSEETKTAMGKHSLKLSESLYWTAYANDNNFIQYMEMNSKTGEGKVIDGSTIPSGTKVQVSFDIVKRAKPTAESKNYASCVAILVEANSYKPRQSHADKMGSIAQQALKAMRA